MAAALRFLESRARATAEVRGRLVLQGYRPDLVESCVERLTEIGMLDDDAFAKAWVESRDRATPRGERALRSELRKKGVDRQAIDVVLESRAHRSADPDGAGGDPAAARRLLEKSSRSLDRIADVRARRQRAYALLARNGFDSDTAVAAIDGWLRDG